MKNTVKTIEVNAKLWFDKTNANTYHNVEVIVKNKKGDTLESFFKGLTYGYDRQYMQTAAELIKQSSVLLKGIDTLTGFKARKLLESRNIQLIESTTEARRQSELN